MDQPTPASTALAIVEDLASGMGEHVPYILETDPDQINSPKYWADWHVQTAILTTLSDVLESRGLSRQFSIEAVIFGDDQDWLLVDCSGALRRVAVSDVQHEQQSTTRH